MRAPVDPQLQALRILPREDDVCKTGRHSGLTSPSLDFPPDAERTIQDNRYFVSEKVRDGRREVRGTLVLDRVILDGKLTREAD